MSADTWKVIVCGTRFGRVYLSAVATQARNMSLAGVLAAGSERSRTCAARFGVPLYTSVSQLPADIDAACVVIGSEIAGGKGTELATQLLGRGMHVLQEHPMHHHELARLATHARQHRAVHRMNTFYPHLRTVRRFLAAARRLLRDHPPVFVEASCSLQLKTSLLDLIGRALGRLRPWSFQSTGVDATNMSPFRSVEGVIGGTSVHVRLQNQLHDADPDNHAHLYHSLTIGTAVGSICLVDTHGPIVWRPRPHIPREIQDSESPEVCIDPCLDEPTTTIIDGTMPTWRDAMSREWPAAAAAAIEELRRIANGARGTTDLQYDLSLLQMVHDFDAAVGPPERIVGTTPTPLSASVLHRALDAE